MFYLQVPSHVTPLSPAVLNKMFERASMVVRTHGTTWGGIPWTGLRRRATLFILEKLFGVTMLPLFVEGANYYVVAEEARSTFRRKRRIRAPHALDIGRPSKRLVVTPVARIGAQIFLQKCEII